MLLLMVDVTTAEGPTVPGTSGMNGRCHGLEGLFLILLAA